MASLGSLVIELAANTARMQSDMGRAVNIVQGAAGRMTKILGAAGLSFTAGQVFTKFIQNSSEAQASMLKLESAVKRAGAASNVTVAQISALANGIQSASRFSDEAIKDAATNLLRFDKVTGETFTRALKISADLAEVMGTDVSEAASSLGKALQLPGEGLKVLTAAGIKFNDEQIKTLQYMTETGRAVEAQNIILDELAKRTSGAAADGVRTLGGAFSQLANQIGELAEVPSAIDKVTRAVNLLAKGIESFGGSKVGAGLAQIARVAEVALNPLGSLVGKIAGGLLTPEKTRSRTNRTGAGASRGSGFDPLAAATASRLAVEAAEKSAEAMKKIQEQMSEDIEKAAQDMAKSIGQSLDDTWQEQEESAEKQHAFYQGMLEQWEQWDAEATARIGEYTDEMTERARRASETMQAYFTEFLFDPFDGGLKRMLNGFIDVLRRMVVEAAAAKIFGDKGSGGFGVGSAIKKGVKGLLGFAGGGYTRGRDPIIVGERGPEIFSPGGPGTITPNHKLGGAPVINLNIDARGSTTDSVSQLRALVPSIIQQAVQLSRAATRDDISRGAFRSA